MNFRKLMTHAVIFSGLTLAHSSLIGSGEGWAQDPSGKDPGKEKDQREHFSDGGIALDPKGPLKAYQKLDAEHRLEKIQFQMVMDAYAKIAGGNQYRVPEEGLLVLLDLKRNKGIYFYDDTWEPKKEESKLKRLAEEGKLSLPRDFHPNLSRELAKAGTKDIEELKTEFEHRMHLNAQKQEQILIRHPEFELAVRKDQEASEHKGFEIEEAVKAKVAIDSVLNGSPQIGNPKQDSTTVNKNFRMPASQEVHENTEAVPPSKKDAPAVIKAKAVNH